MGEAILMNEMLRLALVINTNHSKFTDNLANVIVYILYSKKDEGTGLNIDQINNEIVSSTGLTFTIKEIKNTLDNAIKRNIVNKMSKDKYAIGEEGFKKLHNNCENEFDIIIKSYVKEYNIDSTDSSKIFDLICDFLYYNLNDNIDVILAILSGKGNITHAPKNNNSIQREYGNYTEEQKKIINDFMDWNNNDKNKMLYQLISFGVDYCCLTVKKNRTSFINFFKGKVFYLDSNIIYRLMGINNENRQKTTHDFIKSCKEAGVILAYSSYTKQEILDSLTYHVNKLSVILQKTQASPDKIRKLFKYDSDDGLYNIYHKWARTNGTFGEMRAFVDFLKDEFYKCVQEFKLVNFDDQMILHKEEFEAYAKSFAADKNYTKDEKKYITIETDIQNFFNIKKLRSRNNDKTPWNTKEYIISADHYFVNWAEKSFRGQTPYVVLPSVWYSLILKLNGRTDNDYKSYVEFMKIRYSQSSTIKVSEIIYNINKVTPIGVIQDKIIEEITEGNLNNLDLENCEDIPCLVQEAYDNVLEKTHNTGFTEGEKQGHQSGINKGKEEGLTTGKKIGALEQKINDLEKQAAKKADFKLKRNKILVKLKLILFLFVIVAIYLIFYKKAPAKALSYCAAGISTVVSFILNNYINKNNILITDKDEILRNEKNRIAKEVDKHKEEIKLLEAEI